MRQDIARFHVSLPLHAIPWRQYTIYSLAIGQMLRDQAGDSTLPTDQSETVELYKRTLY